MAGEHAEGRFREAVLESGGVGNQEDLVVWRDEGVRGERVGEAELPEIDSGGIHRVVAVVDDADELQVVGVEALLHDRVVVDLGDD